MIPPHETLSDRYEIEALLGQGGMAEVYRGTDLLLHRTVAIKVLSPRLAEDGAFLARFRREAQAAAGLNHRNIVGIFDTGSDGDRHFIVMEYVEGPTLADVLRDGGALQADRAAEIAKGICEALSFAHRSGLVHRDIKPGNIMVSGTGEVKLTDFGIARAATSDNLTKTATVLGTATYFSPEQARGERVDQRSDVYSLGVVLYEMLAGRPPFGGDSAVAIAYKHVQETPPPISSITQEVPRPVEAVVAKAMAKEPKARYQSASEFGADLSRLLVGEMPLVLAATVPLDPRTTQEVTPEATEARPELERPAPAPAPVPSRKSVEPPLAGARTAGGRRTSGRAFWPAVLFGIAALAGLALILAFLLGREPGRTPSTATGTSPATTEPSPTPSASSTASSTTETETTQPPEEIPSVGDAAAALQQVVDEGRDSDEISPKAANDIEHLARDALKEYDDGNLEEALGKLDELRSRVDELLDKGEITSEDRASRIHQAVSDLAEAMRSHPPEGD